LHYHHGTAFATLTPESKGASMATWNEVTADPDPEELAKPTASDFERPEDQPADPLHKPAKPEEYNHDKLSLGDLLDNVTDTFDGEISSPRG
jgi:hypothetical protein